MDPYNNRSSQPQFAQRTKQAKRDLADRAVQEVATKQDLRTRRSEQAPGPGRPPTPRIAI